MNIEEKKKKKHYYNRSFRNRVREIVYKSQTTDENQTNNFIATKIEGGLSHFTAEDILDNFFFQKDFRFEHPEFLGKRRKKTPSKKNSTKIRLFKHFDGSKEKFIYKDSETKKKEEDELKKKWKYLDPKTGAYFNNTLEFKKIKMLKLIDEIAALKGKRAEMQRLMELKRKKIQT